MKAAEFNNKWEDYLESDLDIEDEYIIRFLDKIFTNYLSKIDGFKFQQIKIKFNQVRFYSTLGNDLDNYTNLCLVSMIECLLSMYLTMQGYLNKHLEVK